ncbi:MAG: histidine phosphatase family protein [Actinobacteria bacterium]|nr:histidine phosphatase family protein [Actinomycetota bacterium]
MGDSPNDVGNRPNDMGNRPNDVGNRLTAAAGTARVLMVRHGESEWNVLGKWQGRADIALTEAGRQQARSAAAHLRAAAVPVNRVLASTLRRAHETAEIIAEQLGLGVVMSDERLVETDVGPWEGLRADEIEAAWPRYLRDRKTPPGFEPPDQVFARATQAIRDAARSGDHTLIVSHSGVIRTIRRVMALHDRRLHNLEGCTFSLDESGELRAHDFVALVANARDTTNDSV